MKRLRYRIYDAEAHRFLRAVEQIDGNPLAVFTTWTHHTERAQLFPGVKSARQMRGKLGGRDLIIINERGKVIP